MIDCLTVCPPLIQQYRSGASITALADAAGLSPSGIRMHLRVHGESIRSRGARHQCNDRCSEIIWRYQIDQQSMETIGGALHLTRERIRQILATHDVERRLGYSARAHACDAICAAVLAEPQPISYIAIAERLGLGVHLIGVRARHHKIAVRARHTTGHVCGERCLALIDKLRSDPTLSVFTAARLIGMPMSWVSVNFRGNHPEFPVRARPIQRLVAR